MKRNRILSIPVFPFYLVVLVWLISCGSTAPFAERDVALKSIDLAKSVESEKYAPDEYRSAVSEYDAGEKLIVTDKKSKQNNEAKAKYVEADNQAKAAYAKSVIPYIESFIQRTDEAIEEARIIKTDIARKEQFDQAVSKNTQARDAFNNKNYEQAKTSSLEAYDIIKEAQAETLALREQAEILDEEYAVLLSELKTDKAEAAIPDEYGEAVDNYEDLQSQFQRGYYEEVMELYQEGIDEAKDLLVLIEEKRIWALESLEEAEESIAEAKDKVREVESQ